MVVLVLFSLCLQGCQSTFQVTSEEPVPKKLRATSDGESDTSRVLVPGSQSDMADGGLPTATLVSPPSVAASRAQAASSTSRLAAGFDVVSWQVSLSAESESEVSTKSPRLFTAFGSQAWSRYFGEVGEEPSLPADMAEILDSPCPFWAGKSVKDTHLLVLVPSTVDGKAFTLDLLEELIRNPRGDGHRTQYFLYDDEMQPSSRDAYSGSSYWVLLTHDVLPGSRSKPYEAQKALVAAQASRFDHSPYEVPNVLEVATAILSYYVCSGHRLYERKYGGVEIGDDLPSTSTRCTALLEDEDTDEHQLPITVGRFGTRGLAFLSGFDDDVEFGISCLRKFGTPNYRPSALLHAFGAEEWSRYFGEVGAVPPLPEHIVDTLNSPCPFWAGEVVKDTHLLVLIPATVAGRPFSLNLLGELIRRPRGGGYATDYDGYADDVRIQLGTQSPEHSYWVLMTRDVLEGSMYKTYASQIVLVAHHAGRTGLPYWLPSALEAATAILSNYVRSGERLYTDAILTWTRCQDLVAWEDSHYPAIVGCFSSGGLDVGHDYEDSHFIGMASLRKL